MTAYSDLESAVAAFQAVRYEYLPKPFDVDHAVELIRRRMEESTRQDSGGGRSDFCPRYSRSGHRDAGSLPGDWAARAIARNSCLSPVNREPVRSSSRAHCIVTVRALQTVYRHQHGRDPKDLLESELFGHERGAFTGAPDDASRSFRAGRRRNAVSR
jgi:two-component system nitrogen regulation response regulator GlnG